MLYLAAFDGDHECLRLVLPYAPDVTATTGLLLEYGATPDVPGWDGRTPYQQAVRTGQDQVAGLLARHGASTVLSPDDPKPPSPEVAALLRARGIPGQTEGTTDG